MLEILKRKKVDKQDKQMPQSIEQLIEHYDLEKLWPYIEKIASHVNVNIEDIEKTQKTIPVVVNSLESNSKTDALAAEQGKVLNEKIEKLNTYSTEEINTGKRWIDGKPIYRKVFTGKLPSSTQNAWSNRVEFGVDDIEDIITLEGTIKNTLSDGRVLSINAIESDSYRIATSYLAETGYIQMNIAGWTYSTFGFTFIVIAEYTKTTD